MNVLIPMAGEGKRFLDAGYTIHKPLLPTINRYDGKELPMVVCATNDLPDVEEDGSNLIYIMRSFHENSGVQEIIRSYYPNSRFVSVDELTDGQACTCLLASSIIDTDEPLLIAGCDNGMYFSKEEYERLKEKSDAIVFTFCGNHAVCEHPNAYGWVKAVGEKAIDVSVKKQISDHPENDHAIVSTFWFKSGSMFVKLANRMIQSNDRIRNEFYVDQVIRYFLEEGCNVSILDVDRYIGWGTPDDYENYNNTWEYWRDFWKSERLIKK